MSVPNFMISYSYWANIACFRKVTREVIIELLTYMSVAYPGVGLVGQGLTWSFVAVKHSHY